MHRLACVTSILLLAASLAAAADDSEWGALSIKFQAGVGMNTGSLPAYDYLATSGIVSGDLHYRLNRHVALVPVSLSFYFYSGTPASSQAYPDAYQQQRTGRSGGYGYVEPGIYSPFFYPSYYGSGYYGPYSNSLPNLAWGLSFTPGIKFQTAGRNLFNFYGQAGAGLYRHNQKSSSYYGVGRLINTSFAARTEAGVEIILKEHLNLLAGGGYMWISNNPAFDGIVHLNMGVRVGF